MLDSWATKSRAVASIRAGIVGALLLMVWVASTSAAPQAPGVELGPNHTRQVKPGQTVRYNHTLTNTGTTTDTFLVEVTSAQHWPAELIAGVHPTEALTLSLQVGRQMAASFQVSLTVPPQACGVTEFTVVTATSQLSPTVQDTATDNTIVLCHRYLPLVMRRWPPIPYQPTLDPISNPDGDSNYYVTWTEQPSRLADTYTLEEATDAAFTAGLRNACTTVQQTCLVSGRWAGTYYYRVQGHNSWGYGIYSNIEAVTVLLPDAPTLNAIDNPDGDGSYSVTWSAAARATSYTLQEDTDSAFGSPTIVYDAAGQSWSATSRSPGTYYYRVRANGPTGQSGWSNIQSATVTPPPSDVLVTTSKVFYHTPYDTTYLYVVGVLLNNTSSNQYIDDIVVTFYDAQGAIVGVWGPYPNAYVMSPGQRAPFKDYSSDIPVGWTRYTVEVYHNETSRRPYSFAFSNTNYYYDAYDCLHVVGRITNSDSRPTSFLEVYATLFDTQDNIVNCDSTFPAELDPGESTTFDISICESTAGWAYFELGADSLVWQASADEVDSRAERR
jgi:hypothetical protein